MIEGSDDDSSDENEFCIQYFKKNKRGRYVKDDITFCVNKTDVIVAIPPPHVTVVGRYGRRFYVFDGF